MPLVAFTVPGVPRGKGRPKFARTKSGGVTVHTPSVTRSYEGGVKIIARAAMRGGEPMQGPVIIEVAAHFLPPQALRKERRVMALTGQLRPTNKPDADNVLKIICDALNGVVWNDDTQVVRAVVEKHYSEEPRVAVCVRPWEGNA